MRRSVQLNERDIVQALREWLRDERGVPEEAEIRISTAPAFDYYDRPDGHTVTVTAEWDDE